MPKRDACAGGKEFAFVSTNFEAKGGRIVLRAFRELRKRHSDAYLFIVGDLPPDIAAESGVSFVGLLRKEVPEEYQRLQPNSWSCPCGSASDKERHFSVAAC